MTPKRAVFIASAILIIVGLLIADHFMAEARLKKIAEHTGEIYEEQMRHLKDNATWEVKEK